MPPETSDSIVVENTTSSRDWRQVVHEKLAAWGRDSQSLDDEGVDPPGSETIQLAVAVAQFLSDDGKPPPTAVVPDPNGGIVFEWDLETTREVVYVWDDGETEYQRFVGTNLVDRRALRQRCAGL